MSSQEICIAVNRLHRFRSRRWGAILPPRNPEIARVLALRGAEVPMMPHAGVALIWGPDGRLLASAQRDRVQEEMIVADLDPMLLAREHGLKLRRAFPPAAR